MVFPTDGDGNETDRDLDRINRELARVVAAYNQTPDPEMGNLSPEQVYRLTHSPWGGPDGAIQFNEETPLSLLTTSVHFCEMRGLLLAVVRHGGVKATAKKNLPRSFVAERMEAPGNEDEKALVRKLNKVINEWDYFELHIARVVCEVGNLLRLYKGRFVVPKKHEDLLREERAGELYGLLLRTFFKKFNMDYLSPYSGLETPSIQSHVAYTVYRLGKTAREWRRIEDLYPEVFLPAVRQEIKASQTNPFCSNPATDAAYKLFNPLIDWGLLEARKTGDGLIKSLESVRVSPLYEAFLRFKV